MAVPHWLILELHSSEKAPTGHWRASGGRERSGTAASSSMPRPCPTSPLASVRLRSESSWSPPARPPPGAACGERTAAGCDSIPRRRRGRRVVGRASAGSVAAAASDLRVVKVRSSGHLLRARLGFAATMGRMVPPDWLRSRRGAIGGHPAAGACAGWNRSIRHDSCRPGRSRRLCVRCHRPVGATGEGAALA